MEKEFFDKLKTLEEERDKLNKMKAVILDISSPKEVTLSNNDLDILVQEILEKMYEEKQIIYTDVKNMRSTASPMADFI